MKLFQKQSGIWYSSSKDERGDVRYISLRTKDRQTAEEIAQEIVPQRLTHERSPIGLEVARYIVHFAEFRSKNHSRGNAFILHAWALEMLLLDCSCVQEISTKKLQIWFYAKARSVKISTARAYLFAVQHFLKWVREYRRLTLFNAAEKVRAPRHTKMVRRNFLSLAEAQRLIDHCVDSELRFALFCAIHAGLRYGEVDMARPEWFDLERKLIHVQPSVEWQPKNGQARTIPMSDEFHEFLQIFGLRSPFMIAPQKLSGGAWRYRYDFRRRYQRLTMTLGINCSFHDLRRTFASLKVSAGISIYKVAKWCGHRVDICEKHYGHLTPCDEQINVGLERKAPAPEVIAPEPPAHLQLTWEELKELVWSKPMTRAARDVGLTDNGLRKMCFRLKIPLPPQGYWNVPPAQRGKFLERACRSHRTAFFKAAAA